MVDSQPAASARRTRCLFFLGVRAAAGGLALFPQVVDFRDRENKRGAGPAFAADSNAVLDSVQRLRADALKNGKLKSTQQQSVSLKTGGDRAAIIVIEPANPQVVLSPARCGPPERVFAGADQHNR